MRYDFDTLLDRRNTHSLKWDHCRTAFGLDDVIPEDRRHHTVHGAVLAASGVDVTAST